MVLAPPIPVLSFTLIDTLMNVGSVDWPVCAADGVWSQRPLGSIDSLSGTCVRTRARGKAIQSGIWANVVCGLAADNDSVHQADNRLPAMRLRSL